MDDGQTKASVRTTRVNGFKASENVGPNDLESLKALADERKLKRYLCVSLEARRRQVVEITILPIHEFLTWL